MKNIKIIGILLIAVLLSSCYVDVALDDNYLEDSGYTTNEILESYDLWYIDINATKGSGEVPFLQRAFTVSFTNGRMYANTNLVGIGSSGNGYGIAVGYYDGYDGTVDIDHNVDGSWMLDVYVLDGNSIELYDAVTRTSYYLEGYQLNTFDYDAVFYENINYFLQEYDVWEKTFTSETGTINDFDEENYLQFLPNLFRSSVDIQGTPLSRLQWDFSGNYQVYNIENDETLKTLTLSYDFMGNDYFELYVINDSTIELYHPSSKTIYEFRGRGYKQYLKSGKSAISKKRIKTLNATMKVERRRIYKTK